MGGLRKKICLTGGGTAGHVTPHFAITPGLLSEGVELLYIGSKGIEKKLVEDKGIAFYQISVGKLRRYFSFENMLDVFRVLLGIVQSLWILIRQRPSLVFSKGGYVSVPVAVAAWLLRIPVITHESDLTPGLATKIVRKLGARVLCTFKETTKYIPDAKWVGSPFRRELKEGSKERAGEFTGLDLQETPVVLIMGGSTGSVKLNKAIESASQTLLSSYQLIHLTGRGKATSVSHSNYVQFEFVSEQLPDLYAAADYIVGRAGSNAIFEYLALGKPMLLIPLDEGSRGDQILNADAFVAQGWAKVLPERDLTGDSLVTSLNELVTSASRIREKQAEYHGENTINEIQSELLKALEVVK